MAYLFGIVIAVFSILLSLRELGHSVTQFIDHVAIFVVIGGTLAIAIVILPWHHWRHIIGNLFGLIIPRFFSSRGIVKECLTYVDRIQSGTEHKVRISGLGKDILKDGQELITLGFNKADIQEIIQQRILFHISRTRKIGNAFKSLSKYPPAFGLMGTVFGLVELMRAISEGLDPSQTGTKMAIALVATLYGLLLANLVVAPIAESIAKKAKQEEEVAAICLEAVLMAADRISLVKVQEIMNSHLARGKRIDYLGGSDREAA